MNKQRKLSELEKNVLRLVKEAKDHENFMGEGSGLSWLEDKVMNGSLSESNELDRCCDVCGRECASTDLEEIEPDVFACVSCEQDMLADDEARWEHEEAMRQHELEAQEDYMADMKMDSRRMGESAGFDKFMDRILIAESAPATIATEESPMRKRAAMHQDRPLNKVRIGAKR